MDVRELPRIDAVADRHGKTHFESLFGLNFQRFCIGGEQVIARIVQSDAVDERRHAMRSRIEHSGPRAPDLADAHASHPAGHHHDAEAGQQRNPRRGGEFPRPSPVDRQGLRLFGLGGAVAGPPAKSIVQQNYGRSGEQPKTRGEQQTLQ